MQESEESSFIESQGLNLHSSSLQKLPFPQYLVFYNGLKEEPDRLELPLSDAFRIREGAESCLEFKAVMININLGRNRELMEHCRTLKEYAQFVSVVREQMAGDLPWAEAVDEAVSICIERGILADVLSKHRAEVRDMVLTEYDEQKHMACERAEGREEGRAEGREEGRAEGREEGRAEGREEGREEGRAEGINVGVSALVQTCMELGVEESEALRIVKEKFSLTDEKAAAYMKKYWRIC